MAEETFKTYQSKFATLSEIEKRNWTSWYSRMKSKIQRIPEPRETHLDRTIYRGITDLKKMDVVIKQADKNLGMVAIRTDIYHHLLMKHLNSDTFEKVPHFPHFSIALRLRNILKLQGEADNDKKQDWLDHANDAREPCPFYIIPKLHKPRLGSRPITAQHSYMLAPLSNALSKVLQVEVDKHPEIAKDSKVVMQRIEDIRILNSTIFVTYDVEQLYPSIDLSDAIQTLERSLPCMRRNKGFWTKILKLIMYNNYVTADEDIYRQMKGTATGTQVAPPFANLYLYFKFKPILAKHHIFFQSRYIDDGLLICPPSIDVNLLIRQLQAVTNLKLTYETSPQQAVYLDLVIYKGLRYNLARKFDVKTFFKPTNKFLYLPFNSNHPTAHKKGVIKGEAIRCLRGCSDKAHWFQALRIIYSGMMARGYHPVIIKKELKKVRFEDRERYIFERTSTIFKKRPMVLTRFHRNLREHWKKLLAQNPVKPLLVQKKLGKFNKKQLNLLEKWPPQLVFKDFRSIGSAVISAKQSSKSGYRPMETQ